ncbi:hypothetical protein AQUSIP_04860 [Aquicella siphonis]|uniref:Transposase IS4-like domain-containing protein n=1 Tax=Aquicella siphonis TaxID=254247 RepID=A0A5E4PE08_9COXI|nr:IS4 family transposase [Aquicella siphonis]VVC75199.1 hypothetical protein AQUSIP_04860 [Aquicella siphonis]
MQGKKLLHKFMQESSFLHKKVLDTLTITCDGLLKAKKLSVTALGRAIASKTPDKHAIKRVDRLVSNPTLEEHRGCFYKALAEKVVPKTGWCPILVDTSCLTADSEFQLIRASLALDGRGFTLFEMAYRNGTLSQIYEIFLEKLNEVLPEEKGHVILISDAGFHNKWFHLVKKQKWDFIGRIRQDKHYTTADGKSFPCKSLHKIATLKPTHHGTVFLCKKSHNKAIICDLYSIRKKIKGRKMKTKKGAIKRGSYSKAFAKGQKEPWVLASSLPKNSFNPEQIVRLYSFRMQIEESFRDMKNNKYGFSFKNTLIRSVRRLNALMLIAAIVNFIVWSVGVMAEQKKWHLKCQSNTSKKRTLSLSYLGAIILKSTYFQIKTSEIENAIKNIIIPSDLNIMERQF